MPVCKRVVYTGSVQGVGFRMTAARIARDFAVAGSVRNCTDGSVELVVQGEAEVVQRLLSAIARQMRGYITGEQTVDAPPTAVEGFQIIH